MRLRGLYQPAQALSTEYTGEKQDTPKVIIYCRFCFFYLYPACAADDKTANKKGRFVLRPLDRVIFDPVLPGFAGPGSWGKAAFMPICLYTREMPLEAWSVR